MPTSKRKRTNGGRKGRAKRRKSRKYTKSVSGRRASTGKWARKRMPTASIGTILPNKLNVNMPFRIFEETTQLLGVTKLGPAIRLGSIFNPNITLGSAAQPMSKDEWQNFYGRYRVTHVTIKGTISVRAQAVDSDVYVLAQASTFGLVAVPPNGTAITYRKQIESGRYKMWNLRVQNQAGPIFNKQTQRVNWTIYPGALVKKVYPSSDNMLGWAPFTAAPQYDDNLGGTAEPQLSFYVTDGELRAAASVKVIFALRLMYHCVLSSPNILGVS